MLAEIRGRGSSWRVFTPDESALATPLPVYDQDGVLVEVLMVGAPPDGERKMIERFGGRSRRSKKQPSTRPTSTVTKSRS